MPGHGFVYSQAMKFGAKRSAGKWEQVGGLWQRFVDELTSAVKSFRWVDYSLSFADSAGDAERLAKEIIALASRYNYVLAKDKFVVSQRFRFLGIIFDSVNRSLAIPPAKLKATADTICSMLGRDSWSRKELESLLGSLFHFTKVLPLGRGYISRLLSALKSCKAGRRRFQVTDWVRADLSMWLAITQHWTGTSLTHLKLKDHSLPTSIHFWVDASPTFGVGIVCEQTREWMAVQLSTAQLEAAWISKSHSSTALEAFALPFILIHFPDLVQGRPFAVTTDSMCLKDSVAAGHSNTHLVEDLLRTYTALALHLDSLAVVSQVPREQNRPADALAGGDIEKFFRRAATDFAFSPRRSPRTPRSTPPWVSLIGPRCAL